MSRLSLIQKGCLSFLVLLCISISIFADPKDVPIEAPKPNPLTIKGDLIIFEKGSMEVTAKGGVKLFYRGYEVNSEEVRFSEKEKFVSFPSRLTLVSDEMIATADSFNYNLGTFDGKALGFRGEIDRLLISGEKFVFSKDKIVIYDALFTTCQKNHWSHYDVKAKKIYLYPQLGFFISISNKITISALPFPIPIPTYLYGAPRYGILGQSTLFPIFGSNKIEGQYIKERIGYFLSDSSSGTVEVGLTKKLGLEGGVEHAILLSKRNKVQARTYIAGTDGFVGHLMFQRRLFYKSNQDKADGLINEFFKKYQSSEKESSTASLWLKHREIVNDYRVSYLPVGILNFKEIPLHFYNLSLDTTFSYGKYSEERGLTGYEDTNKEIFSAYKHSLYSSLSRTYNLSPSIYLKTSGHFYGYWYDTQDAWTRTFAKASLNWKCALNPKFSYTKRIFNRGSSPFRHDSDYAIETDEIGLEVSKDFKHLVLASDLNYDIENFEVRSWDIKAGLKFHCWQFNVILKPHQNGIGFGVDIY